jgi:hypothetical protein
MNYGLLALSFLLCGIGLILEFVFFEPFGFMFDGLGFMLFLYVILVGRRSESRTSEDVYRSFERDKEIVRRVAHIADSKSTWVCPDCQAINLNEDRVCYKCRRIKPIVKTN